MNPKTIFWLYFSVIGVASFLVGIDVLWEPNEGPNGMFVMFGGFFILLLFLSPKYYLLSVAFWAYLLWGIYHLFKKDK